VARRLASDDPATQLASVSANVMGLCTLANLFGNQRGLAYVISGSSDTSASSSGSDEFLCETIDIALRGLSHDRPEIRQVNIRTYLIPIFKRLLSKVLRVLRNLRANEVTQIFSLPTLKFSRKL
jgi:hypothetical protein